MTDAPEFMRADDIARLSPDSSAVGHRSADKRCTNGGPRCMVILKARSLNVRTFGQGMFNGKFIGIQFGVSLPFMHVVRHNGAVHFRV